MATYLVGRNQTYTTLQAALDALDADYGGAPFTAEHEIVFTDRGPYEPGRVSSNLQPTSTYRLIIRTGTEDEGLWLERTARVGETTKRAIISGDITASNAWTGIYVDFTDYVTIRSIEFTKLKAGVIFYKANYGIVENCHLIDNEYYGVQFFQSNRGIVFNSSLSNSSTLISILRSSEAVVVHNSLVNKTAGLYALWAEWHAELDGSVLDRNVPIYYAYNNIMVGYNRPPVVMPLDTEKTLANVCNGNIYWCPSVNYVVDLYQIINDKQVSNYKTLVNWSQIANTDKNSYFVDPELLTTQAGDPTPGLLLDSTSGILKSGVLLRDVDLPNWLDVLLFNEDSEGLPRDTNPTPTPGPTDILIGSDYDLFFDFIGATSDIGMTSEELIYGINRSVRQIDKSIDKLFPKIAAGYFYVGDAAYYLYAEKLGQKLQDISWSKCTLPQRMEVRGAFVEDTSSGSVTSEVPYVKRGTTLWACHAGATLSKPVTEAIKIVGVVSNWESSSQEFVQTESSCRFAIRRTPIEHYLRIEPKGKGPLVITDDSINSLADRSLVPFEYSQAWDENLGMYRLRLQGSNNLFTNTHLYNDGLDWNASPTSQISYVDTVPPPVGANYQKATVTTDTVLFDQTAYRVDRQKDVVASWYLRSSTRGRIEATFTTYRDDDTQFAETSCRFDGLAETSNITWKRYVVMLKANETSAFQEYGADYDINLGSIPITTTSDESSYRVRLRLKALAPATSELACPMMNEGDYLQRYTGLPYEDEMTIEYDSSDSQVYNIRDLSLSNVVNPQHSGFITIGNVPIDNIDTSVEAGHTTLSDSYVPMRLHGLPWAKIDGPSKLRYISGERFGLSSQGLPREIGFLPETSVAINLAAYPNPIVVSQGRQKTFSIAIQDQFRNPLAFRDVALTLYQNDSFYAGLIGIRELGVPSKLGHTVTVKTDASGYVVGTILAPDKREIGDRIGTSEIDNGSIPVAYEINPENYGNIKLVSYLNNLPISTTGTETSEVLTPTVVSGENRLTLTKRPVFTSMKLDVAGTSSYDLRLNESLTRTLGAEEYYVDYATGRVYYSDRFLGNAKATYKPQLAWAETSDPTTIRLEPSLLSSITSDIIITYDATAKLKAEIDNQTLIIPVVYQNPEI